MSMSGAFPCLKLPCNSITELVRPSESVLAMQNVQLGPILASSLAYRHLQPCSAVWREAEEDFQSPAFKVSFLTPIHS